MQQERSVSILHQIPDRELTLSWPWVYPELTVSLPWADRELTPSWPWAYLELTVSLPWADRERTLSWPWAYLELTVSLPWADRELTLSWACGWSLTGLPQYNPSPTPPCPRRRRLSQSIKRCGVNQDDGRCRYAVPTPDASHIRSNEVSLRGVWPCIGEIAGNVRRGRRKEVQVALDLRRSNLRRFRILKPGQKVEKIYFTVIYNVLQFFSYCFLY
jgi:hypothetical protein